MCIRDILSMCVCFTWLFVACGTPPAEQTSLDAPQPQPVDAESRQEILELLDALQNDPYPRKYDELWTSEEGYYPYLDLGKAYLKANDPFSASYYCSRSLAEGISPVQDVEECLDAVEVIFKSYRSRVRTPEFPAFPWPPPEASSQVVLPPSYIIEPDAKNLLRDVASRFECALSEAGYGEYSYYQIPQGFALVTRIEQFNDNGTSAPDPDRWAVDMIPPKIFSFRDYLKALFRTKAGHYRVIGFLVTSVPFSQSRHRIDREDAIAWLSRGMNVLPWEIGEQPYSAKHYCTAFIYEFEQTTRDHEAEFKHPGIFTAIAHLDKSFLLKHLKDIARNSE